MTARHFKASPKVLTAEYASVNQITSIPLPR
jgi:hypothetical protein